MRTFLKNSGNLPSSPYAFLLVADLDTLKSIYKISHVLPPLPQQCEKNHKNLKNKM